MTNVGHLAIFLLQAKRNCITTSPNFTLQQFCILLTDHQNTWSTQEREAKRAKLKSENAHAYIQEDTSASSPGQAKHITAVSSIS